ncbi:hypothetical protein D8674_014331 [Pyrus ussuriensis x Pyrus communis]|uniref:Uncharacterized protein n=1 Tax=Pyrus ussuriensis x Pyrus communis TaxID=2448454 RepID=A0A5N5GXL5_9ROSA|nr:hypothetical protein D8674_014331 [Pyrus ussuriensis x Pyrus communis]
MKWDELEKLKESHCANLEISRPWSFSHLTCYFLAISGHHSVLTWYESLLHVPTYILTFESLDLDLYRAQNWLLKLGKKSRIFPVLNVGARGAHTPPPKVLCSTAVHGDDHGGVDD